MTDSDNSENYY